MSKPDGFDRIDCTLLASQVIRLVAMIQKAPAFRDLGHDDKLTMLREGVPRLDWLKMPAECLIYATLRYLERHPEAYDEPMVERVSPQMRFKDSETFQAWCALLGVPYWSVSAVTEVYRQF